MFVLLIVFQRRPPPPRLLWALDCVEYFGWQHYLSNATCLIRPHLFSAALLVSYGWLNLPHALPLLKKTCVRQVVSDKWFPLIQVLDQVKDSGACTQTTKIRDLPHVSEFRFSQEAARCQPDRLPWVPGWALVISALAHANKLGSKKDTT